MMIKPKYQSNEIFHILIDGKPAMLRNIAYPNFRIGKSGQYYELNEDLIPFACHEFEHTMEWIIDNYSRITGYGHVYEFKKIKK